MINPNQNVLFLATILALCVISFVHMFLFPLYEYNGTGSASGGRLSKTFLDFEQSLCLSNIKHSRACNRVKCPQYGIVTIVQGGRLGNQMWEYASVWAISRRTGLEPYIPRCIRLKLDQIFETLSVPTFEEIGSCHVDLGRFVRSLDTWNYTNQSIVLPRYSTQPDVVLTWTHDVRQEFTFRKKFVVRSERILRQAVETIAGQDKKTAGNSHSVDDGANLINGEERSKDIVFVGVHVRRTDYISYLWRKHGTLPAHPAFYLNAMRHFEQKHPQQTVIFIVVSDDPGWCHRAFGHRRHVYLTSRSGSTATGAAVVASSSALPNAAALDLALLAACNHTIFDYGTFGLWGAILAGGETVYYNLSRHSSARVGELLPKWHAMS